MIDDEDITIDSIIRFFRNLSQGSKLLLSEVAVLSKLLDVMLAKYAYNKHSEKNKNILLNNQHHL